MEPTYSPAQIILPDVVSNRRYWLSISAGDLDSGSWELVHGSWLGRLTQEPEPGHIVAEPVPVSGFGLPVEEIVFPEDDGTLTLTLSSMTENVVVDEVAAVKGGTVYDLTVPAWNCWYRLEIRRDADGELAHESWVGHFRTH